MPPETRNVTDALLRAEFPLPAVPDGGKESRGCVAIVGGDPRVPGAPLLTAMAALRSGCGRVQLAIPAAAVIPAGIALPEAMVVPLRRAADLLAACDAAVVGPGTFVDRAVVRRCARLLAHYDGRCVIDAGALGVLHDPGIVARATTSFVITPHAGEMAKALDVERDAIEKDSERYARDAARRFGVIAVLKGSVTYIADPGGATFRHEGGVSGLATAGSGDVLSGIIGALLTRELSPLAAALWGVRLHARAGETLQNRIGIGFLARQIYDDLPPLFMAELP